MKEIHLELSAKQKEFFDAKERYVLYGGARGGGKSWSVQHKAMLLGLEYPGIHILIMRRTFPELEKNHILPLQSILNGIATYKERTKTFTFDDQKDPSMIFFGYCESEKDVLQYQGQEYDILFIDEATQMTEFQFETLKPIVRGTNNFPKRTYLTANPGGVGHAWVKRLFIDREYKKSEKPEEYRFISAGVLDNFALMKAQPDYPETLASLPDDLKRAWLYGDWDVISGQFFTEWNPKQHVVMPFTIPNDWQKYFCMDYGLDMTACYWIAVAPDGKEYVYRECCQDNLIVSEAAKMIKEHDDADITAYYAPPDMWSRRNDTGKSVAEIFSEYGIFLVRAKSDRATGWRNMKEHLHAKYDEHGDCVPTLRVFSCCSKLIKNIPLAQFDKNNPDDMSKDPHSITHYLDAIRMFCVSRQVYLPIASEKTETGYESEIDSFLDFGR